MQFWPQNGGYLGRGVEWTERHPRIVGFALAIWYCTLVKPALRRPLWHDELFTFYIAQSATLARMWQAIRTVDLNPPLSYILARAALHFVKPPAFACRMPSLLAFLAGSLLLFAFLNRKTGTVYATLGVLLLWNSRFFYLATEARPYALMFAFTMLLLVAWERATEDQERWPGLFLVTIAGFGLLLSHVFGVLVLMSFWLAETVRFCVRRKLDWKLWACLLVPVISCLTYVTQVHNESTVLFPPQWQPSVERTALIYENQVRTVFLPVLFLLVFAVLWRRKPAKREFPLSLPEFVVLVYLLLVPIGISFLLARSHGALFERYGIVTAIPFAVFPVLPLAWSSRSNPWPGIVIATSLAVSLYIPLRVVANEHLAQILTARQTSQIVRWVFPLPLTDRPLKYVDTSYGKSSPEPPVQLRGGLAALPPELPIVAASAVTFLEMDNREADNVARRLYYLTDTQASSEIAHATLFESYGALKQVFPIRGTIERYQDFVRANPTFLVVGTYGYPEDWLLPKLQADGAGATLAWQLPPSYKDRDVYEITMPRQLPGMDLKASGHNGTVSSKNSHDGEL